jgi:hypothetical protein
VSDDKKENRYSNNLSGEARDGYSVEVAPGFARLTDLFQEEM